MRCPICSEEVRDTDLAERWGPEFAHATCVTAYNAGKTAEREQCAEEIAMLRRLVRIYEHQVHRSVNDLEFGA